MVEETGVAEENHRPIASHWQTLSHSVVSSTPRHDLYTNMWQTHLYNLWKLPSKIKYSANLIKKIRSLICPLPSLPTLSERGENEGTDFNKINILPEHLHLTVNYHADSCWLDVFRKSLKIPKGQSESVYRRRTYNTMAKAMLQLAKMAYFHNL